eukprot:scaffold132189_cov41-Tisochrysis_lutea.AAC.3
MLGSDEGRQFNLHDVYCSSCSSVWLEEVLHSVVDREGHASGDRILNEVERQPLVHSADPFLSRQHGQSSNNAAPGKGRLVAIRLLPPTHRVERIN